MAKIYGLFGSMTGKLADTVMTVRNGEQIARKYQPIVSNPNTPAQIANRAKMKLMSQLSAVLADVIAMRREGPVSSRNMFTKVNFKDAEYSNNEANIDVSKLQLTKSAVGISTLLSTRNGASLQVGLGYADHDINRMVYVAIQKLGDGSLIVLSSTVVEEDPTGEYSATITVPASAEIFVLGYGIRLNNEHARVIYGELESPTAQDIAKIIVSRNLTEDDITLTKTVGIQSIAGQNNNVVPAPNDDNRSVKKK